MVKKLETKCFELTMNFDNKVDNLKQFVKESQKGHFLEIDTYIKQYF
jgi:hypothetical protein